jgi:hypothetical protein
MKSYKEKIKRIEEISGKAVTDNEKEVLKLSMEIARLEQQIGKGMKIEDIATKILEKKIKILLLTIKEDAKEYEYLKGVKDVFEAVKPLSESDFRTETLYEIEKKVNYFINRIKEESRENKRDQKES